ncbi:hypothetical protein PV327_001410 [Microctonus hyperodae]|uniref:Sperm microtubule inner protein 1 C-terminal domain-containing protein n=1 Tax=Microctonus hyperodae TaxID=165561 RepID=A0AA39G9D6_MICHY|nr:hypothetical protein PV327_001410 [Microctonus hyperodae]
MMRKTQAWDINNQKILIEAINNENTLRRKWFEKNRERLLKNLQADSSELVKKKLKRLQEQRAHWEIKEPIITQEQLPQLSYSHESKNIITDYMRPVDEKVLAILYEKDVRSHEARKNYLRERYKTSPEDKFYITDCTNWNYGWRLKDFPSFAISKWGQTSTGNEMFLERNSSALKRDPDISRMPQAISPKNFNDILKY